MIGFFFGYVFGAGAGTSAGTRFFVWYSPNHLPQLCLGVNI